MIERPYPIRAMAIGGLVALLGLAVITGTAMGWIDLGGEDLPEVTEDHGWIDLDHDRLDGDGDGEVLVRVDGKFYWVNTTSPALERVNETNGGG